MVTLIEKFNNDWPDWVIPCIKKLRSGRADTNLGDTDIANVEVHKDYNSSYFKDPSKICFFLVKDRYDRKGVLIKSDDHIYHDVYSSWTTGSWTELSKKSQKFIEENMTDFCWIDKYETDKSEVHADSRDAMSKVARQNKGQFKRGSGDYARWVTPDKYDKSGYKLNPDKYVDMLYKIDKDSYAQQLERIYKKLNGVINYFTQIENNLGDQYGVNGIGKKNQIKFYRMFSRLQDKKEDIVEIYIKLYTTIAECLRYDSFEDKKKKLAELVKQFVFEVNYFNKIKKEMDEFLKEQEEELSLGDEFFT